MKRGNGSRNGLEKYYRLLLARRSELQANLRAKLETLAAQVGEAAEDLAPVYHDQFVALQFNQLDSMQLKLVDAALKRLDSKDYGVCLECGDPISGRRLEAIPWAVRCITCQERLSPVQDSPQLVELVA